MALASVASVMAQQMARTTAEVPGLTYQIYNDLLDRYTQEQDKQYARQQDAQDRADALAKQRASITGPRAPTNQGRQSYWQDYADQRTKQEGRVYIGTTT